MSLREGPRAAIAPFLAMEMVREAQSLQAQGRSIVRFDVGQPFEGPGPLTIAAAQAAMAQGRTGYTEALGLPSLRQAIAAWYGARYGVRVFPAQVAITAGASGAFVLAFLALFQTGDRVAMASPGYPPYRHILTSLGFEAALADAREAPRLQLTPAHLEALGPIAGALIASPANPTGTMLGLEGLTALAAACRARAITLISDEIYHGLSYGAPCHTALEVEPDALVINSFSKYWAMTGWRVGWIVAPAALMPAIERLAQNLFICPPAVAQEAALSALQEDAPAQARLSVYAENRRLLLESLPRLGLPLAAPSDGAFYALLDITAHSQNSQDFCRRALHEAGVAMTPGVDFCETRGATWVRLAYARRTEEVAEGLKRLAAWL
jgi:aspartate/methionine/tyrosine aminotransferase